MRLRLPCDVVSSRLNGAPFAQTADVTVETVAAARSSSLLAREGAQEHTEPVGRRLLLIEDDPRIRLTLRLALEDEGYHVEESTSGEEGLAALECAVPDVLLVDLRLPGIDGFEVCRRVRRTSGVPIIAVTARSDTHDVVAGLEAGADDYVTKPVVAKELAARIRALLRRADGRPQGAHTDGESVLRFGTVELYPERGVVQRDGDALHLTKTEFRLLCELGGNAGRLVSREDLLERVWGYGYFGDTRLVDVHMHRLRAKIEDDPSNPRHLLTVRGLGYKLVE